jgi:hypothetical protein
MMDAGTPPMARGLVRRHIREDIAMQDKVPPAGGRAVGGRAIAKRNPARTDGRP